MVAKQVADLITIARGFLAVLFPWLAFTQGITSLPWAAVLLAADWTGDVLDGALAKRSGFKQQTWVGAHDLEIDMAVSLGLLIYLIIAGFLNLSVALIYLLFWGAYFLRAGIPRSMGMLFQAPIYGWFIYVAILHATSAGLMLSAWVVVAVIVTWPRFPQEVIPGFLHGMRDFFPHD
jgi:phosphatidylglycerophosphate synthase